ncbi:MAG: response regulator transcription factor [Chloroflexi bacterium]|nr:response regulator transcription factor [Chloroflexota bacterium]MYJ91561.1 response regulator transcription factor [Chloroflexota bacterium]
MPTPEPITVLVVDDHPIMRQGICDLLNGSGRFSVVGEAADGEEALRTAAELKPQVVVMDVIMPRTDGIEACRELMALLPDTRVMMLTAAAQEDAVIDAIAAGATGFVEKYAPPEEFITAVSDVAAGRLRVPDEAVKRVFAMLRGERPLESIKPLERLTAIERETLTYFASGTPYGEIARQRGISVVTVRNTLYRIQDKLGIETKPELVIWAVRNGLVDDIVVGIDEQ